MFFNKDNSSLIFQNNKNWIQKIEDNIDTIEIALQHIFLYNIYRLEYFFQKEEFLKNKVGRESKYKALFLSIINEFRNEINEIKNIFPNIIVAKNDILIFYFILLIYFYIKKEEKKILHLWFNLAISSVFTILIKYFPKFIDKDIFYDSILRSKKLNLYNPSNQKVRNKVELIISKFNENLFTLNEKNLPSNEYKFLKNTVLNNPFYKVILYVTYEVYIKNDIEVLFKKLDRNKLIEALLKMFTEIRHRINQSTKSIAYIYYQLQKKIIITKEEIEKQSQYELEHDRQNLQLRNKIVNNFFKYYSLTNEIVSMIYSKTSVPEKDIRKFSDIIFNQSNYTYIEDIIDFFISNLDKDIIFSNQLSKQEKLDYIVDLVTKVTMIRKKINIREILVILFMSDPYFRDLFSRISIQYKRKYILALSLSIGISIYIFT